MEKIIGRILATEQAPTKIDEFTFWTNKDLILNPFDIVKVRHINESFSYGVVEDIGHITDAASFLTNFISSDFGNVEIQENTERIGMNYVKAKVICNNKGIYIPLHSNAEVMLADKDEITYALGLNDIKDPLVCGYVKMYENAEENETVTLPVNFDSKFLVGPEGAHLNISGISGLAAKTSYAMFLLKSIQEYYLKKSSEDDDSVAFILFNVKGRDLLSIDQINDFMDERDPAAAKEAAEAEYSSLGIGFEPFKKVHYYYPNSSPNYSNTYMPEDNIQEKIKTKTAQKYAFTYEGDKENIDLMFSSIDDPSHTMESIIEKIINNEQKDDFSKSAMDWGNFLEEVRKKTSTESKDKEIPVVSWRKFYRIIKTIISGNPIFQRGINKNKGEVRICEAVRHIKKNEVHVIDIAKLPEDKQAFVFGSVVRTVYNMRLGADSENEEIKPPSRIVIFIDELNKYSGKDTPKQSPILRQILDVAERGRSLGIVLLGAEQFRSAIHERVTGNCSTHAYGRTNSMEISKPDYKSIPQVYKNMMTRLKQGEYIIHHPVFRTLLNIKFPKPVYKQHKS